MIDYYEVLDVSPDVTPEALKEQYHFLLNAFHPDKFSAVGREKSLAKAEEKAKEINAAYEVLRDPASRSEYDRKRTVEKEGLRAAAAPPPPPPPATPPRPAADSPKPRPAAASINTPPQEEESIKNCLEIMRETGQASASLFQRRFRIGYTRAARLVAILESRGIVGPDRGRGEREILVDIRPRAHASARPPAPAPVQLSTVKTLEEEQRRLQAEQQKLETQFRAQRIAAAMPSVRRRRASLSTFGCLQGCGWLILAVVGLTFLSIVIRSCTPPKNSPPTVSAESSTAQPPPNTQLNTGNVGEPSAVRRALPIFSRSQSAQATNAPLPGLYSVSGIAKNDALNVHSGPGSNYQVIATLPNGYRGVQVVGASVMNGTTEWVQIDFKNQSGWVTKLYLKAQ